MFKPLSTTGLVLALLAGPLAAQTQSDRPAMLFFDWGKLEIRGEDKAVLDKVAEQWAARPAARILITGHSDRSGPSAVNLRTSKRRAQTVQDYLAAHGVAASAMTLQAYGEQQPVVPTEDGVREVQNRRVEVSFVAGS